ncbi:hypothetical protein B0O99DRAFT_680942 [Bisporella sp. PMI_857]|nr:hypothetical protein B0O99DRAFT_680942 [Bisporella sp. PMI_857]
MKIVVAGATGFVGAEVIHQALSNTAVASIIALSRRPMLPPDPDTLGRYEDVSKLESVVLQDWLHAYPASVQARIKDADACIWTLATTPSNATRMDFDKGYRDLP